jgi:hypothetical protein
MVDKDGHGPCGSRGPPLPIHKAIEKETVASGPTVNFLGCSVCVSFLLIFPCNDLTFSSDTARSLLRFATIQYFESVQQPAGLASKGRFITTKAIERNWVDRPPQKAAGKLDDVESRVGPCFYFTHGTVRDSIQTRRIDLAETMRE